MGLSLKPEHLPRYRDMAVLLVKYGRSDMVFSAEGAVLEGLQKVANRITLGLILAAMIVGAAMLMRVETSFRIMGYPGLAMLFFLGAALGASWMAFGILRDDRQHRTRRPT